MNVQLPRLMWADSGEVPTVLAELGWNRFRLFARSGDGTWRMSAPMTAHEANNPYTKRLDGSVEGWTAAGKSLNGWLDAAYAELTGEQA